MHINWNHFCGDATEKKQKCPKRNVNAVTDSSLMSDSKYHVRNVYSTKVYGKRTKGSHLNSVKMDMDKHGHGQTLILMHIRSKDNGDGGPPRGTADSGQQSFVLCAWVSVCAHNALFVNLYIVFTNVELLWSHIVAHFVIKYPKRVRDDEKIER